jgi:HK97 family phage portal protein
MLHGSTAAGVSVTRESALGASAFWRAVNLISRDIAKLPLELYRHRGDNRTPATGHPARYLLRRKPNRQTTSWAFRLRLTAEGLLAGNGYAWIERDINFSPRALWPLPPRSVTPETDREGMLYYRFSPGTGRDEVIDARDMIHIRALERAGSMEGVPIIEKLRNPIGLALAVDRYGAAFFQHGARPGVFLTAPGKMSEAEAERLERKFTELAGGVDRMHRAIALPNGLTPSPWQMANHDAEFLETKRFSLIDIANAFGVPPHKLGDSSKTSFSSLEQENQSYLDEALDPWLVCWEAELAAKLLTPQEQRADTHSIRFRRQALVRADLAARGAYYVQAVTNGWMSLDEVRGLEEMNAIPGGLGKPHRVPLNTIELGAEPEPEPATPSGEEPAGATMPSPGEVPPGGAADPESRARREAQLELEADAVLLEALERLGRRTAKQPTDRRSADHNIATLRAALRAPVALAALVRGNSHIAERALSRAVTAIVKGAGTVEVAGLFTEPEPKDE